MAVNNIRRIGIQLSADVNNFVNQLGRAERSMNGLSTEMRTVMRNVNAQTNLAVANLGAFASQSQMAGARMSGLSQRIRIQSGFLNRLNQELNNTTLAESRSATETRNLEQRIIRATTSLRQMNNELTRLRVNNSVFARMTSVGQSMTSFGLKASVLAYPLYGFIKSSIQASMTAEELQNKVSVAFGDMTNDANEWAQDIQDSFGIAKTNILDSAASLNLINRQMGLGQKTAAQMSKQMTQLAFDISSLNEKYSFKEAFEKIRSGMTGESMPLLDVGINVKVEELKRFGLDKGILKEKQEITGAIKQYLIYRKILEDSKLTQNDFANTINSTANQTKIASEQFEIMKNMVGDELKTAFSTLIAILIPLIKAFNNSSPEFKKMISYSILAVAVIGPLISVVGALIRGIGILGSIIMRGVAGIGAMTTAVRTASVATGSLSTGIVQVVKRFGALIARISGVLIAVLSVAAGVFFLTTAFDESMNLIKAYVIQIKDFIVLVVQYLTTLTSAIWLSISKLILKAVAGTIEGFAKIVEAGEKIPLIGDKFVGFANLIRRVKPATDVAGEGIDTLMDKMAKSLEKSIQKFKDSKAASKDAWASLKGASFGKVKELFNFDKFKGFKFDYDPISLEDFIADLENVSSATKTSSDELEKMKNKIKSFVESIKSKAESFKNAWDLFQKPMLEATSGERLLVRLEAQKKILEKWKDSLLKLRGRLGADSPLFQELLQKGPQATGQLMGLATLDDAKLASYAQLYGEKSNIALGVATGAAFQEEQEKAKIEQIAVNLNGGVYVGDMSELANMIARQLKLSGVF